MAVWPIQIALEPEMLNTGREVTEIEIGAEVAEHAAVFVFITE